MHNTVIDGEIVALDEAGRPSFNLLQNYGSSVPALVYYLFDVVVLDSKDVKDFSLAQRRELLEREVLSRLDGQIRYSTELRANLSNLISAAKVQGFEGLIAKRRNSRYEPGLRSGAWQKMRINRGQEFVIGGYTIGGPPSMPWYLAITRREGCSMRLGPEMASLRSFELT